MRNQFCWLTSLLMLVISPAFSALAQSDLPKYEIGLHTSTLIPNNEGSGTQGGGIRFTYNFTPQIAVEAETNLFNSNGIGYTIKAQALAGLKAGARFNRWGIFGKARPGFVYERFSVNSAPCYVFNPPANSDLPLCSGVTMTRNNFALDLGGVLEIYPSRRWALRLDVGDTVLRRHIPATTTLTTSPPISTTVLPAPDVIFSRHHLQANAGVSFRF
jgi:hypothetical protein